jgi:flagellar hook-length control protein FliK
MNGLPIDINTSATPPDNSGTRRSRRDGDLRGAQFEQLLLALTAAKPLPRATKDLPTSSSTKTSRSEYAEGPAANPTRCVARDDTAPSVAAETDVVESDLEVESTTDDETQVEEKPPAQADPDPRLMVCHFDHKLPTRPETPSEESAGENPVIEGPHQADRKPALGKSPTVDTPSVEILQETQPAAEVGTPVVSAVTDEQQTQQLAESDVDPSAIVAGQDHARRLHRGRQNKEAAQEQVDSKESTTSQVAQVDPAISEGARKPLLRRGEEGSATPDQAPAAHETNTELPSVVATVAAEQAANQESGARKTLDPATKEGLENRRGATTDDAPKVVASNDVTLAAPPNTVPTSVVPPVSAPAAPIQGTRGGTSATAANSKTDSIGGVTATPAHRLSQKGIPTTRSTGPAGSSQIDTVKFIQRIARAMQTAREAGGEIRLRLSPPELGSMKMEVKVQDGTLVAKVETETAHAQSTLVDNLPALKERLAEQGVRIERFDVDVSRDDRGQNGFAERDHSSDRGSQQQSERRVALHRQVGDSAEAGTVSHPITTPQSINVVA